MSEPCKNCRKTERALAEAIGIIEKMLATGRVFANAERAVIESTDSIKAQRVAATRWIENLE